MRTHGQVLLPVGRMSDCTGAMGNAFRGSDRVRSVQISLRESKPLLVVIGRRNHRKPSLLLDRLVADLVRDGASVLWFEGRERLSSCLTSFRAPPNG